jgi:hypothetical protein
MHHKIPPPEFYVPCKMSSRVPQVEDHGSRLSKTLAVKPAWCCDPGTELLLDIFGLIQI